MNIKDVLIRISEIPTKIQIQGWETKLSHIGNLENLTTENKTTLVDAINEVKQTAGGASEAIEVSYDDSTTSLGVTNVQEAIVALNSKYKAIETLANQLDLEVNGQVSSLNTYNSESETIIGIPLTTKETINSSQTKTNIIKSNFKAISVNASDIAYVDDVTLLGATDVQKAIEALFAKFDELEKTVNTTKETVVTETANLKAINAELQTEIGVMAAYINKSKEEVNND